MKPTVQLFVGDPLSGHEARFLRKLYADLEPVGALILANFHARQRQIDFVVVTASIAAILELKHLPEPVFGRENGPWMVEDHSGARKPYPGPNPWRQALEQKYALSDEMREYERQKSGGDSSRRFYTEFDAYLCIDPKIHSRSDVIRGDKRVAVRSYHDVVEALRGGARATSWSPADWTRFATEHLSLTPTTLGEATDQRVRAATNAVRGYLSRVESVLGFGLAPLLSGSDDRNTGHRLVGSILSGGENHLIIGPSGSAKTFHLHHVATAAARQGNEVPFLVEPKTYRGGEFWSLVRRGIAPMFVGEAKELLAAVRIYGLRPLLLIDALNECPAEHLGELLRGIQTFALHFGARVVLTSQAPVDLPSDLTSTLAQLTTPPPDEKRLIYCYHAGIETTDHVDYFCEAFTNAYELTVAGRCHASGPVASSRVELFDRYVQTCLPQDYYVGTALLRAVASDMARTVSSSWERTEYERFAERFLQEQGGSIAVLDRLRNCHLIRLTDDFFSFEHELLADYFAATEMHRRTADLTGLAVELNKPRNQRLIELILPRLSNDDEIGSVLRVTTDPVTLARILAGRCGHRAKAVLLAHIGELFTAAINDLAKLSRNCYVAELDGGRKRLGAVSIEGSREWDSYAVRLCQFVAQHLDEPQIAKGFLSLLDLTEWSLRRVSEQAATTFGLKGRRIWEEIVHRCGGILTSSRMDIPCSVILAELRMAIMSRMYPDRSPIWQSLYERAVGTPGSHFALLTLFQHRLEVREHDLAMVLDLVRRGWDSGIYNLRIDALVFIQWIRHDFSEVAIAQVREMLQGFETKNIFVNTSLIDALMHYGGAESPVTADGALAEMRSTIAPGAPSDRAVIEAATAFDSEPMAFLASRAHGCLSNIFEDVFQGAYCEAYSELSREEKSALLTLAATSSDASLHSAWLIGELLQYGTGDALSIYERFATGIDPDTSFQQESTAAFLLAIQGCARFTEKPPAYAGGDTPAHRAWALVAQIVFWMHRGSALARALWSAFEGPTRLAAADVLYNVAHCRWQLAGDGRASVDLVSRYPQEIRGILEDCLRERGSLPTVFRYGGSRNSSVVPYLIETLGRVGNEDSLRLLQSLIDDADFGASAITAIEAIRRASRERTS